MVIVLAMAFPYVVAQTLGGRAPVLRAGRAAIAVVIAAVGLQLLASQWPDAARTLVPMSFALGTAAFTSVAWTSSHRIAPAALAFAGGAMNLIPIALHGAMPVVAQSRARVSETTLIEPTLISAKHQEMTTADLSLGETLLSDWIPVPLIDAIISVGDLVLLAAFVSIGLASRSANRSADSKGAEPRY